MDWRAIYEEKLMGIGEAAGLIEDRDVIWIGLFCTNPVQFLEALEERREELHDVTVVSGMNCKPFRYLSGEFKGHINAASVFMGTNERKFYDEGNISVNSVSFSQIISALKQVYRVDTLCVEVSEPDEEGYLYFGPMGAAWSAPVAAFAKKIIVQVNRYQGKVRGKNTRIHVKDVDAICRFDHPLPELASPSVTETDEKIASFIVPNIKDGSVIQIGFGGIANAVAYFLEGRKNIGIYTEMLTDSLAYLYQKGVIDPKRVVAGFGMGTQAVYDWCNSGVPEMCDITDVTTSHLSAENDDFISINSCLMADLTGQVCSESIGFRPFSGIGGQLAYVRSAGLSKGGQSYLCLRSTVKNKRDGSVDSTIHVSLPPGQAVTTPRTDVMFVVTEYGLADLHNKPVRERVEAMIGIAHPDFRERLRREAGEAGLL